MKKLLTIIVATVLLISCNKKETKSFEINDFSTQHKLKFSAKTKNPTTANMYLSGTVDGKIYLSTQANDSTMVFEGNQLPKDKIMMDFYGGDFVIYCQPSNVTGSLLVRLEIQ